MVVVDGLMMLIMNEITKEISGAIASIISFGQCQDCLIHLNWYQERISVNIWANGTIGVNYFNANDQQTGWDFQPHEKNNAISIVKGLINGIKGEVICD